MNSIVISGIRLTNFKRFSSFYFSAKPANVLVGPNNSGKSSILDALRVAYACLRYSRSNSPRPTDVPQHGTVYAFSLPHNSLPIPIANIATNYSEDDAVIEVRCSNGNSLFVRINPERAILFYATSPQDSLRSAQSFRKAIPLDIRIVPTLGPLEEREPWLTDETVQRNASTRLANRCFRNIWLRRPKEDFSELKALVSSSWPNIELRGPEITRDDKAYVQMFYSENRIDRELFWSGFGFQVWLQMLTHLLKANYNSIIIIDEPDIYLHPDLQRRLLKTVKERFAQFFMATHSVEIINESESKDVASINSTHRSAKRISTEDDYQALFNYIGSYENIDFSRLARAKRIVFFEGNDRKLLQKFAARIGARRFASDTDTVVLSAGGFSQWRRVKEVSWTFREVLKLDVKIFTIFDRDFRCDEDTASFQRAMRGEGIDCHVLSRKELENYALTAAGLQRVIQERQTEKLSPKEMMSSNQIDALLNRVSDEFKHDTLSQLAANQIRYLRSIGSPKDDATIMKEVSISHHATWSSLDKRLHILGGKEFLAALSSELQKEKGFSITLNMLVDRLADHEVGDDLKSIVVSLEEFCDR